MGFTTVADKLFLILAVASMLVAVTVANKDWYYGGGGGGFNYTTNWPWWGPRNESNANGPNKIIVGGSDHWRFGFNYSVWAFQNAPIYVNDILGQFMNHISFLLFFNKIIRNPSLDK